MLRASGRTEEHVLVSLRLSLARMASSRRVPDDHLHAPIRVRRVTQGLQLEDHWRAEDGGLDRKSRRRHSQPIYGQKKFTWEKSL